MCSWDVKLTQSISKWSKVSMVLPWCPGSCSDCDGSVCCLLSADILLVDLGLESSPPSPPHVQPQPKKTWADYDFKCTRECQKVCSVRLDITSVWLHSHLSIDRSINSSIHLSVCPPIHPSVHVYIHPPNCSPRYLFICLYFHLPTSLPTCSFIWSVSWWVSWSVGKLVGQTVGQSTRSEDTL